MTQTEDSVFPLGPKGGLFTVQYVSLPSCKPLHVRCPGALWHHWVGIWAQGTRTKCCCLPLTVAMSNRRISVSDQGIREILPSDVKLRQDDSQGELSNPLQVFFFPFFKLKYSRFRMLC